jgi:outer membrane protein assembly factor BamD
MRVPTLILISALLSAGLADAAVVFGPTKKDKLLAPGEEEISGSTQQLFQKGQEAEKQGNLRKAVGYYRALVRKHPKDALAPGAAFRASQLLEELHDYLAAADGYRFIVERFQSSPDFDESIEAQFRIGEMYLNGKKIKFLGVKAGNALERAVEIFAAIIRTAPYGKYTARAQFDIGLVREKQKINDAAISAYEAVVEKFPNDPVASNAQYQIGYLWFNAAKYGTKDLEATDKARTAFQDFLFRYPNSEKAAQARANLEVLNRKQTSSAFNIAKFYDKQKHYRAAVIYYNEVIRQQPGSSESEKAKKRIDQIKAKVGEKALLPISDEKAVAEKKKQEGSAGKQQSAARAPAAKSGPLPPAETDPSLPPAASLLPDTTTAPAAGPAPDSPLGSGLGLGSGSSLQPSASPDATASPAP